VGINWKTSYTYEKGTSYRTVLSLRQEQYEYDGAFKFSGRIGEVINSLEKIRDSVPKEFRSSVEIEFECYYESSNITFAAEYDRPATEKEKMEYKIKQEEKKKGDIERKRIEYLRLKQELGE
jgi:hypothetical protein